MQLQRRIFVLEDELLYLELVVAVCQKSGYEVLTARTVDEAVMLMEECKRIELEPLQVDAIWLDHFLPEKNGTAFVNALLQNPDCKDIPIFLVTNAVEEEITNWYIKRGIKQVYHKMMHTPEKILADIDYFLQRRAV